MARLRNVCFTLNNPTAPVLFNEEKMDYLIMQLEVGEEGTTHIQGYCELKTQQRLNAVKALLGGPTVHIEARRGTQQQAIDYCKKDDTRAPGSEPKEFGTPKKQGKRNDINAFRDAIILGKRERELILDDDYCPTVAKYPKLYAKIAAMDPPKRTEDLEVTLLIGPTGLGKTRYVIDKHLDDPLFYRIPLSNGTMWYDGYDKHTSVLMDDFAGAASHMTLVTLLQLLDRYPVQVPIKGGHTWYLPTHIYLTSNILPAEWYKWDKRLPQYDALARRITKVLVFQQDQEPYEEGPDWWTNNKPEPTFTSTHNL